jgi:hypothetical protein
LGIAVVATSAVAVVVVVAYRMMVYCGHYGYCDLTLRRSKTYG